MNPTDRSRPLRGKAVQRLEVNQAGPWSNALTLVGKDNSLFLEWE